jgi:hypothetical protein
LFANSSEHEAEQSSYKIFSFADDNHVDVSCAVGPRGKGIGVAGRASPYVGVDGCENDVVGIGPVIVEVFPDAPEPSVTSACDSPN